MDATVPRAVKFSEPSQFLIPYETNQQIGMNKSLTFENAIVTMVQFGREGVVGSSRKPVALSCLIK
jgi:hypothetical protein